MAPTLRDGSLSGQKANRSRGIAARHLFRSFRMDSVQNGVPTGIRTPVTSVKGQHAALEYVLEYLHNGGIMEDQYGYAQREEFPGRLV